MDHPLCQMLRPKSIAVIGASRTPGSIGNRFVRSLVMMGYSGRIFPVNPKAVAVGGIPCINSIAALPGDIDVAAILLPQALVAETLRQLGEKGIRQVIIVSAGFKEVGGDGPAREAELVAVARRYGIRILGPNCMGVFNSDPAVAMNASFSPITPVKGNIAFISQSGALGVAAQDLSLRHQQGFSVFVSLGNKCDLDEADFLEFLDHDDNTKVVMLYLENVQRPEVFRAVCRRIVRRKPVLVVKAGRSEIGSRAASSHTGALASADTTVDAFFKQCGAIRCATMEEMLDIAMGMSVVDLDKIGPNVAVVSGGGGPCILAADALELAGLKVPALPPAIQARLRQILPPEAGVANPVDMIASAGHDTYAAVFSALEAEAGIDTVMFVVVRPPGDSSVKQIIETLAPVISVSKKAVVAALMCDRDENMGLAQFRQAGVPVFGFAEEAAQVLRAVLRYRAIRQDFQSRPAYPPYCPVLIPSRLAAAPRPGRRQLPLADVFERLERAGVGLAPYCLTADPEEAARFAEAQAGLVVVKNANEQIIHKSDAELVRLRLRGGAAVRQTIQEMRPKAAALLPPGVEPRFLVQSMVSGFPELVAGMGRDPQFGPVLMFGLGGILVEVFKDVSFRVAPLEREDVTVMLGELRGHRIFDGVRGQPPVDREQIVELMLGLGRLAESCPDLQEMDLNPLIWDPQSGRLVCVDARMTVG